MRGHEVLIDHGGNTPSKLVVAFSDSRLHGGATGDMANEGTALIEF